MKLEELGYSMHLKERWSDIKLDGFEIGRIILEHKERYRVQTEQGELEAEITGNMRFSASGREDFPAVGDWVALTVFEPDFAIIHRILPRFSTISRQAVGGFGELQVIAANVDFALLLQAVDRDFSINRLERYLTICHASGVSPIIVLTKTDLIGTPALDEMLDRIRGRIQNVPLIAISNETQEGYEALRMLLERGKTYCMLGSSGVGKSTLLNKLSGQDLMKTGEIGLSANRGKHITSHRELIVLDGGGILIDNPGMREVGITDSEGGLESTFEQISRLSLDCRFRDCSHTDEKGCRVLEAVEQGDVPRETYDNFIKMEKEKAFFESTLDERRRKEREFGKYMKNYKKDQKRNNL